MASSLAQLACPHCRAQMAVRQWPRRGNDVPRRWESEPGPFRLLITCPRCRQKGYVAWSADPGPLLDSEGKLLAADDLVAEGASLIKAGDLPLAIDRLEWALVRDSKHSGARQCLAVAFGKAGQLAEAVAQLKLVLQHDPQHPGAHYNLGALYHKQGRHADAIREMEIALELDPAYEPARAALDRIRGPASVLEETAEIPSGATMILRAASQPQAPLVKPESAQPATGAAAQRGSGTEPRPHSGVARRPLRLIREFVGHDQDVRSLAFYPLGGLLASASTDATVRFWDYVSPQAASNLLSIRLGFSVAAVCFTSDGERMAAVGGLHARLWLLDRQTVQSRRTDSSQLMRREWKLALPPPERRVTCAAFSPDGQTLVTGNECRIDGEYASVWNVSKAALKQTLPGDYEARSVAFSPGGKWLAISRAGRQEGSVDLWHADTWTIGESFPASGGSVAFSHDGSLLAVPEAGRGVQLWHVESGQRRLALGEPDTPVTCLAFSGDGRFLASGGEDNQVRLWNAQTGELVGTAVLASVPGAVQALAFSPDHMTLAATGSNCKISLWELPAATNAFAT